jgi:hypothetical protein
MLTVCGQLFTDSWPFLAVLAGVGIGLAIYEGLTHSGSIDED